MAEIRKNVKNILKKQDNHKKPRKLMDQVRDVMRLNRNRERISRILSKRIWGYRERTGQKIHERDLKIRYNV